MWELHLIRLHYLPGAQQMLLPPSFTGLMLRQPVVTTLLNVLISAIVIALVSILLLFYSLLMVLMALDLSS